jgi:hypothetical protein
MTAMRSLAVVFAVVGIVSGVLFAAAPFIFGTPTGSPASFIMPTVVGLSVVATHRLNFRKLRDPGSTYSRARLLIFNLLLLGLFIIGFLFMYRWGTNFGRMPLLMACFVLLWPLPLAVNVIYFCDYRGRL